MNKDTENGHKAIVADVLMEHLEKLHARLDKGKFTDHLTSVMSDVNGTLDVDGRGGLLDGFLCDWHDAGLPVLIATGVSSQDLPFDIVERLQGHDAQRGAWFVEKPFKFSDISPGMVFDDDQNIARVISVMGGTGWDVFDASSFLESWSSLSAVHKQQALQPFIELHSNIYPQAVPPVRFDGNNFE